MSFLAPLLEVQDLDLAADAARKRSTKLPERDAIPQIEAKLFEIDVRLAAANALRSEKQAEEEQISKEVIQTASDIEAAEVERYSGKRKNQDEAVAHKESQARLHEKQNSLEVREMELLEEIEAVESQIEEHESDGAVSRAELERVGQAIRKVEEEVSAELVRLTNARAPIVGRIPENVFSAYERVRAQAQKGGRGAGMLAEGRCGGCRIKLPSLEKTRMLQEPEDALIQCPQCRRVLVR